jgi:hypothetical protein
MSTRTTLHVVRAELQRNPSALLFPVRPLDKRPPCFDDNLALATNDVALLSKWHAKYHAPNWGIALARSHLIVLDVDRKPGKRGQQTLNALEAKHGKLPPTFTVQSPTKGLHLYFRETEYVKHRALVSVHGFGLDIDSTNYVIAAGCQVAGGGMYRAITDAPIADAPVWFGEYLKENDAPDFDQTPEVELDAPGNIAWAIHFLTHDAPHSIQGRNGEFTLLMVAAALKDHGISEHKTIELINEHYNVPDRCEPQWQCFDGAVADRLDVKIHNAWLYLRKVAPGAHSPQADFANDPVPSADELKRLAAWWKARDVAVANGEQPTRNERRLMREKKKRQS